jgi:outer membrane protein assembly factor BamB
MLRCKLALQIQTVAITLFWFGVVLPGAHADDWPQWLGPQRDAVWRETGIIDKFPAAGPTVRWRAKINAGYTGPAVADGKVFVMDRLLAPGTKPPKNDFDLTPTPGTERVVCLDAAMGDVRWVHPYDCPYVVSYQLGPRTTPLVSGGKVYTLGTMGHLFCLDADKGTVLWSRNFPKDFGAKVPLWGYAAHPLLDGQKLICMVGGKDSTVVAFDKDTGKEIWRALSAKQLGYCPPSIYELAGKRQLIVWHGEAINGLDPETGKVYWKQPVAAYQAMAIAMPRKLDDALFITATFNLSMVVRPNAAGSDAQVVWRGNTKVGFDSVFATPFAECGVDLDKNPHKCQ